MLLTRKQIAFCACSGRSSPYPCAVTNKCSRKQKRNIPSTAAYVAKILANQKKTIKWFKHLLSAFRVYIEYLQNVPSLLRFLSLWTWNFDPKRMQMMSFTIPVRFIKLNIAADVTSESGLQYKFYDSTHDVHRLVNKAKLRKNTLYNECTFVLAH